MAYDAQKAHEYYINYKKKGLKKGRKKGSKKSTTTTKKKSLVGLSTSGLNDMGKMEWALAKEKLTEQMNTELKNAGSDEERAEIRKAYQKMALQALQEIKNNAEFAAPKKAKAGGSAKSGGSGSKAKAGTEGNGISATKTATIKSASNKNSTSTGSSSGKVKASGKGNVKVNDAAYGIKSQPMPTEAEKKEAQRQQLLSQLNSLTEKLKTKIKSLPEAKRKEAKAKIQSQIKKLKEKIAKLSPAKTSQISQNADTPKTTSSIDIKGLIK